MVVDVEDGDNCIVVSTAGGRGTVPANRRPEVMLKELVVVVVEIRSNLVEEEEVFDGTWLGALLLLHVLLSELDLACR